jgi:phosphoglycolate phosphatase
MALTSKMGPVKTIFWDWNGTLLNDASICIASMNQMLARRGKPLLTKETYQDVFTFPVIDYYRKIGWDFKVDNWDELAFEFIDLYQSKLKTAPLHRHARSILGTLCDAGYRQAILSAMEEKALLNSVTGKGIQLYFERIAGIGDHYAYSKADIAVSLMKEMGVESNSVCLVGDTLHDLEVAGHLQCSCILVSGGHQNFERLATRHNRVITNLKGVLEFF